MDLHRGVASRIVCASLARDFDNVARHVLSLLREDAGDVGRGAGAECDE